MKTLVDLDAIKKETLGKIAVGTKRDSYRVLVGMATCGMAAGAKPVYETLVEEFKKQNIINVDVIETGCVGACRLEPLIEVVDLDGYKTTYIKMDSDKAIRVVKEHIAKGNVCLEYTIGQEEKKEK